LGPGALPSGLFCIGVSLIKPSRPLGIFFYFFNFFLTVIVTRVNNAYAMDISSHFSCPPITFLVRWLDKGAGGPLRGSQVLGCKVAGDDFPDIAWSRQGTAGAEFGRERMKEAKKKG
jgi:hypothetical protein